MRLTPQSASSPAKRASCEPLVVSVSSSRAPAREVARQRADQRHDVLAHQRLAAGEPELAHAAGDEGRAQPVELLERQHVLLRQEGHVLRHAIDAAEVAAVGHRDAQIGDRPAERVDQGERPGTGGVERHRSSALDLAVWPYRATYVAERRRFKGPTCPPGLAALSRSSERGARIVTRQTALADRDPPGQGPRGRLPSASTTVSATTCRPSCCASSARRPRSRATAPSSGRPCRARSTSPITAVDPVGNYAVRADLQRRPQHRALLLDLSPPARRGAREALERLSRRAQGEGDEAGGAG